MGNFSLLCLFRVTLIQFISFCLSLHLENKKKTWAQTAMITASHAYLVTRSKNIKNGMFSVATPYFSKKAQCKWLSLDGCHLPISKVRGYHAKRPMSRGIKKEKKEISLSLVGLSRMGVTPNWFGKIQRWHFWNMLQPVINMCVRLDQVLLGHSTCLLRQRNNVRMHTLWYCTSIIRRNNEIQQAYGFRFLK